MQHSQLESGETNAVYPNRWRWPLVALTSVLALAFVASGVVMCVVGIETPAQMGGAAPQAIGKFILFLLLEAGVPPKLLGLVLGGTILVFGVLMVAATRELALSALHGKVSLSSRTLSVFSRKNGDTSVAVDQIEMVELKRTPSSRKREPDEESIVVSTVDGMIEIPSYLLDTKTFRKLLADLRALGGGFQ